jgi:hypothetical protein
MDGGAQVSAVPKPTVFEAALVCGKFGFRKFLHAVNPILAGRPQLRSRNGFLTLLVAKASLRQ